MHVTCMVAIKYSNVHNELFVLTWYSKFIACNICVTQFYTCVGEHNKKMSFKKIVAIKSQETQNKSSIIVD